MTLAFFALTLTLLALALALFSLALSLFALALLTLSLLALAFFALALLALAASAPPNAIPLDQYGMEYNPVALNEVLAFSYAYYQTGSASGHVPGISVEAVDSLGAGDAFVAGVLACLSACADVSAAATLVPALRFANAVGAITTTRYGAIPALPTRAQVEALLAAAAAV